MVRILNPLTDSRWDERLLGHDDATVFHTAAWARVLQESYGYLCCYLAEAEDERFRFLLPLMDVRSILTGRRGVSLPFTDYCDTLGDSSSVAATLVGEFARLGRERRWKYIEVRGGESLFCDQPASMTVLAHTLDLRPSEEALFAALRESTRRNIRKARREGVEVHLGTSPELIDEFYRLNCLTRRDHGLPPQPLSFFRNLYCNLIAQGEGFIALARVGSKPAGGAVFLHFGCRAIYKYGASDRRFLQLRPNDLVIWEAIRWLRGRGFRELSLGRTEMSHQSLRRYKTGWGVTEQLRRYCRYDCATARFVDVRSGAERYSSAVFRRLPLGVSRMLGSVLYRHVA